jgi:hypothetical protein
MASLSGLPRDHCVDLIFPAINITKPQKTDSPPQVLLPSASAPPTQNWHPMTTRSKNNMHKPKLPSDSHIKYPIPKALLATFLKPFWPHSKHQRQNQLATQRLLKIHTGELL